MIVDVRKKVTANALNYATHDGIFHCDDAFSMAVMEMAHIDKDVYVVRTRDRDELQKADIEIDIGGGEFDHHMSGFNTCRRIGEKYASAGLVWKKFGEKAIKNVMTEINVSIDNDEIEIVKNQIDREIILPIDLEDNGEKTSFHTFSFVCQFIPSWIEEPDYERAFSKVERVIFEILKNIIKDKIVRLVTKKEWERIYKAVPGEILELPAQTFPWLEEVLQYNEKNNYIVKFVIFPYPAGGWAAQCVPPSIDERFKQLVPFPIEWAGADEDTLPEISGVPEAVLCRDTRFFARAKTKEAVTEMCKLALAINKQ